MVRGLAVDSLGRVFVGGHEDIGVLTPDDDGKLRFQSLTSHLAGPERSFDDIWTAHATSEGVYFQSFGQVMRWQDGDGFRVWPTSSRYHKAFSVQGRYFVREEGRGLLEAEGDSLRLIPGGSAFRDEKVDAMLPFGEQIAILSRTRGFLLWDGVSATVQPFPTELDAYLLANRPYSAEVIPTPGGVHYAIATIGGGVVTMDARGRWVDTLLERAGLEHDDLVLDVHADRQGGIWLALNNGIVRVVTPSPLTWFDRELGLEGVVYDLQRRQGELYAATSLGLFRLAAAPEGARFERVSALDSFNPQAWSLAADDSSGVLVAGSSGLYALEGGELRRVLGQATFTVYTSTRTPRVAYASTKTDLIRLVRLDGRWVGDETVAKGIGEVRSITEDAAGHFWMARREGGVLQLDPTTGAHQTFLAGVPRGFVSVVSVGRSVLAVNAGGEIAAIQRGPRAGALVAALQRAMQEMGGGDAMIQSRSDDGLVLVRGGRIRMMRWAARGLRDETPAALFRLPYQVRTLHAEDDGVVWFGTDEGLIRYDPQVESALAEPYTSILRGAWFGGEQAFWGTYWNGAATSHAYGRSFRVPFEQRDARFGFAAPTFNHAGLTEYQVRLDGYSDDWSDWSTAPFKEYTNLSEGSYVFRVRARNAQGVISEEGRLAFVVLPPWYRTWWAYAAYVLGAVALVWGVSAWRLRESREAMEVQTVRAARLRRLNDRLRLTNESLRASDKLKDDLLANTSHELRTPLTAILGFSEMLLDTAESDDLDLVRGIHRGGERLLNTVNGLLDMFKLQSGTLDLVPTDVDAAASVRSTVALLQPLASDRGLDLRMHPADLVLPARVDRDALDRIVTNLVGNAVKFTNEGGVAVTIDGDDAWITLSVVDSGIGIPDAFLPNLFTPFEQASTGIARTHEGTGLGLAIVRRLVDLMGGEIDVSSTVGVGTAIRVCVPRWAAEDETRGISALDSPAMAYGHVLALGLADADASRLRSWVEPSGSVCAVDSLGRAVREMRQEAYDALILRADTQDAEIKRIRLLRRVPGYETTPVLRVGGRALSEERLYEIGYAHQIAEPFEAETVRALLEALFMHLDIALDPIR